MQGATWVAVLREPWLSLLRRGEKTHELRVARRRVHPAARAVAGDRLFVRPSGGVPVLEARIVAVTAIGPVEEPVFAAALAPFISALGCHDPQHRAQLWAYARREEPGLKCATILQLVLRPAVPPPTLRYHVGLPWSEGWLGDRPTNSKR